MLNWIFSNTPLLFLVQSLWRDEAFSYLLAKRNIFTMFVLTAKDFNPPFYYLFLHFWIKLFGGSEISLRTVSFLFYWIAIYAAFLFMTGILRFKTKKAFLYLILFVINPFLIYYAFEARMYSMFAAFASLSLYAFYKKDKKLYIVSTLLGLYTHYFMIFIVVFQFLYSRFIDYKKKIYWLPVVLFLPWVLFFLLQKGLYTGSFWITGAGLDTLVSLLGITYTGYEVSLSFYKFPVILLSLAFLVLIIIRFERKRLFIYLLSWSVGISLLIILLSVVKPIFWPRYIIFSSTGFLLLLIYIIDKLEIKLKTIVLAILLLVTLLYNNLQVKYRTKSDLRTTINEIKASAKPGDVLYVTNELNFFVSEYYFSENRVYIYGKNYSDLPDFIGKVLISPSQIAKSLPVYPKKAFILTSDTHYEVESAL